MRSLRLVAAVGLAAAGAAPAQLAVQQPTTRLLVLPLAVKTSADSLVSIQLMDVTRDKLAQLARYKVLVVPKPKLCEALKASDFQCDVLLDASQSVLLARFLNVNAYTVGALDRAGGALTARVRMVDIGSSGYASVVSVSGGNPGTVPALGEALAQRLNTVVRAGELARECNDRRQKGQLPQALESARKALAIEPNLTAAHLCVETIFEAQRAPVDSQLAAALRATKGDTLNPTAWETVARLWLLKGDTLKAIDAFSHELAGEPQNVNLRLAVAELLRQQRQHQRAVQILDEGLRTQSDQKIQDMKQRICIEGELWRCALDGFVGEVNRDTAKLADSGFVRAAIGAAQQVSDTQQLLFFGHQGMRHFPKSAAFAKALGAAFDLKGQRDSAVWAYRQAVALDPGDLSSALLVAKTIVDGAQFDTAKARQLQASHDTAGLAALRVAFADRLDTARTYIGRALASPDSGLKLSAAVILLSGGSKIAQAQVYDRAYVWLDQLLQVVALRSPADTVGPRRQIRVQGSFWYGVASVASLSTPYQAMVKSKSCAEAKGINERIVRTKDALMLGAPVHPPTVKAMLENLAKFEAIMPQVKKQFKCTSF